VRKIVPLVVALAALALVVIWVRRVPSVPSSGEVVSAPVEESKQETTATRLSERPSGVSHDPKKAKELRQAILRALSADASTAAHKNDRESESESRPGTARNQATVPEQNSSDAGMSVYAKSIQSRVREDLMPMAAGCYKNLLAKRADAGGTIVIEFEILHDESLGGVVNEPTLGDGGTLADDELSTCIRESLSNISFEAPPGKGRVTVKYPLIFSPEDPGDGGE
jgi:hypothetical protein